MNHAIFLSILTAVFCLTFIISLAKEEERGINLIPMSLLNACVAACGALLVLMLFL